MEPKQQLSDLQPGWGKKSPFSVLLIPISRLQSAPSCRVPPLSRRTDGAFQQGGELRRGGPLAPKKKKDGNKKKVNEKGEERTVTERRDRKRM